MKIIFGMVALFSIGPLAFPQSNVVADYIGEQRALLLEQLDEQRKLEVAAGEELTEARKALESAQQERNAEDAAILHGLWGQVLT